MSQFTMAVRWYRAAAEIGYDHAPVVLAEAHIGGRLGLAPGRAQALVLLRPIAQRGGPPARAELARLLPR